MPDSETKKTLTLLVKRYSFSGDVVVCALSYCTGLLDSDPEFYSADSLRTVFDLMPADELVEYWAALEAVTQEAAEAMERKSIVAQAEEVSNG